MAIEVDDTTVSFVALESRECWKSFEEECPECGSTYQCEPDCSQASKVDMFLEDLLRDEDDEDDDFFLEGVAILEEGTGEVIQVPGGLPMWGGPFEA